MVRLCRQFAGARSMCTAALLVLCVGAPSSARDCPCDSLTLFGLDTAGLGVATTADMDRYLKRLVDCQEYREDIGIEVNYCRDPVYRAMARRGADSLAPGYARVLRYYTGLCFEFLDDNDLTSDTAPAYARFADTLPALTYHRGVRPQPFLYAGVPLIVGGAALLSHSIINIQQVYGQSYGMDAWGWNLEESFSKLGAILYVAVSAIIEGFGWGVTTFGIVRIGAIRRSEGEYDRMRRFQDGRSGVNAIPTLGLTFTY